MDDRPFPLHLARDLREMTEGTFITSCHPLEPWEGLTESETQWNDFICVSPAGAIPAQP